MKKIFTSITILFALIITVNAQITFQKYLDGQNVGISSVQQTSDGGYILAGTTSSYGAGSADVYLIKTNNIGNILWTKTFGSTDIEKAGCVQQTNDGGYIILGYTNLNNYDALLIKTDGSGNAIWSKTFGGSGNDYGGAVRQTNDGGYIIAGVTNSFGSGANDVLVIKTDGSGNTTWMKSYGSAGNESASSIQQTTDNGYIITGGSNYPGEPTHINLLKVDASGNVVWSKQFVNGIYDNASTVLQTNDGGYLIGGSTGMPASSSDILLIKTDGSGSLTWSKTIGTGEYLQTRSVQQTSDNGYIIAAGSPLNSLKIVLIKTDVNANVSWAKKYGGTGTYEINDASSVQLTNDGGYIIAGETSSFGIEGGYIIKTDGSGNSGCNESIYNIIAVATTTQVINFTLSVSTGGTSNIFATITGSGGVLNILCSNVGIDDTYLHKSGISVYPNPNCGKFKIEINNKITNKINIEICNLLGEKIFASDNFIQQTSNKINLSDSPKGLYFVKVYDGEKKYIEKIVIQ